MKEIKTISIKCETKETLNLAEMTEFQGGLKSRTDIDYDKIKLSIIKYGFSFPFLLTIANCIQNVYNIVMARKCNPKSEILIACHNFILRKFKLKEI